MARSWKHYERLVRHMAESMGLMIVSVPANGKCPASWHIAQRRDDSVHRLWVTYYSPKRHRLRMLRTSCGFRYLVDPVPFYHRSPHAATGRGSTKVEALKDLLERWRIGCFDSVSPCPAANREELELRLAITGK